MDPQSNPMLEGSNTRILHVFMRSWALEDGPAPARGESVGVIPEVGWVKFDALIELMSWGRNVYTILRLEGTLEAAARAAGTRRVEGSIEEVSVNVGLNRADVLPDAFMYVGKGLQRRLGSRPGDVVRCCLRPADPDEVPLADDTLQALADAGLRPRSNGTRPPSDGDCCNPSRTQ